jgi:dipeptidyl aminopeptidase/acylaminoacyl peptidase
VQYTIQDFLEIRSAAPGGFSPDGSKVLIGSNLSGTNQLYRLQREGGPLEQITKFEEPVSGFYLPTSDDILMSMDEGGNERLQIYLLDDHGSDLREVIQEPEFIHRAGGVSRDSSMLAYASNRRNGVDFDIYVRRLDSGEERRVFDRGGLCSAGGFSPDGRFVSISMATLKSADNELFLFDLDSGETIHVSPHEDESQFGTPRWMNDSSTFYFSTDNEREFSGIAKFDLEARRWDYAIERSQDLNCQIDWNAKNLLVTSAVDGYTQLEVLDAITLEPRQKIPLPSPGIGGGSFSKDGRYFAYGFQSSKESGDAWLYDLESQETTRLTDSPKAIPSEALTASQVHHFTSFDGERVPVHLFMPENAEGKPPVVVIVHGGPESQYVPVFNPIAQYFVHRGYAVAAPNVRGSTGQGKRYHHLDDRRKRLDSVKDLEWLHRWLPTVGVDEKRAVLMGGSYGGFMVLAGLAFQPDLWAAGIDIVGISSWVTFLENTSAWRRKFREREYGFLDEDREFLLEASPITHVDGMKAPLFIIHGTNDPRVPLGEAEQIHAALQSKGVPSELHVYKDEGHGLSKLKNRLDAYPKAVDFLDRVLNSP